MGVYLTGVHLIGVCLMGVYLMGVYLINVHLTGVHLVGVHLTDVQPHGRASHGRAPHGHVPHGRTTPYGCIPHTPPHGRTPYGRAPHRCVLMDVYMLISPAVKIHAGCPTPQPSLCLRSIRPQFVPPDTSRRYALAAVTVVPLFLAYMWSQCYHDGNADTRKLLARLPYFEKAYSSTRESSSCCSLCKRHFELETNHPKRVSSHTMGRKEVKKGEREIEDKGHGVQVK
jgi:hypothetical protein